MSTNFWSGFEKQAGLKSLAAKGKKILDKANLGKHWKKFKEVPITVDRDIHKHVRRAMEEGSKASAKHYEDAAKRAIDHAAKHVKSIDKKKVMSYGAMAGAGMGVGAGVGSAATRTVLGDKK